VCAREAELAAMRTSIRKLLRETAALTARKWLVQPVQFLTRRNRQ
jgi:hypothetical protein